MEQKYKEYLPDKPVTGIMKIFLPFIIFINFIRTFIKDKLYDFSVWRHKIYKKVFKRKKAKTIRSKRRGELIFFLSLVAYPLLQFIIFYIGVNINSIFLAFQKFDIDSAKFIYLSGNELFTNFRMFISDFTGDPAMITATKNSFFLYVSSMVIALPLNLMFSFFIYKKVPGKGAFRVVLFLPQIISSLVVSLMFRYFVESALPSIIGINLLQNVDTGFSTIIFYVIWASFGTQILLYTNAMAKIDDSLVEVGQLEGMSLLQEFWHVTLPLIFPTITVFLVIGVAGFFTNQAGLFNFYGTSARTDLQTLGYVFFIKVIRNNEASFAQYPYAAAAGLLFTLVAAPLTLFIKWLLEKYGPSENWNEKN